MRLPDTFTLKRRFSQESLIFALHQFRGSRRSQEDYALNLNDECFIVADGVGDMPHGRVASEFVSETALWGYKHIRMRPFYWADKRLLLKRIFRSANLALWQKRREYGFEEGLATTLSIAIIGSQKIWVGSAGDTSILSYREGLIDFLTPPDNDERGRLTNALGLKRLGLVPHIAVEKFLLHDTLLMATDGVINFVNEDELREAFEGAGNTKESINDAALQLLDVAKNHGGTGNMTVCMMKKIR
jgi:serine/threonine protein phosphatase PrpC